MNLPKQTIQKRNESESYAIVLYHLRKLGIFRNVTENDYGIDFEIELVHEGKVTGRSLKAQVKASDKLTVRKADGVPTVGGIKQSTLRYWTEISRHTNVILFAVDLACERIYVSNPLFWQCAKLLDGGDSTKTIECIALPEAEKLNVGDANKLSSVLVIQAFFEPTIREQISVHTSVLRRLKYFIQLYSDVFHNDFHVTVNDPECFRELLDLSAILLRGRDVKSKFSDEHQKHWHSYDHWLSEDAFEGPANHECFEPLKVLLPLILDEMELLRSKVIDSGYYWVHTDPEYFKLVAKYSIPSERDHESLYEMPDREDLFALENSDYKVYQLWEEAKKPTKTKTD